MTARTATTPTLGVPLLDGGERTQVLDTLITVLGQIYAHLPAKRAAYAHDPVQALTLLRTRSEALSDSDFHLAVTGIVTGLRDAHTRYVGPAAVRGHVAALPFLVEQFGPYEQPAFMVTKVAEELTEHEPDFQPGVQLEWWNAVPFARAVDLYADRETGGRPDSRRARALESMTFRALDYGPPPDEQWVDVGYRTPRGKRGMVELPWSLLQPGRAPTASRPGGHAGLRQATDLAAEAVRRAKKQLFARELWAAEGRRAAGHPAAVDTRAAVGDWIPTTFQDALAARPLSRRIGYLRIWSFDVDDDAAFLTEAIRLLGLLPQGGLIVDLRGNPGGLIWAAERMLQLFTAVPISPTRFSLVATPATRQMAASPFNQLDLGRWADSLDQAISTGDQYSQPLPLTDPDWCNDTLRAYSGPALAVVDANTYSSGDLFTAGWVDHAIGPLVTVGQATGAGGANVWTSAQVRDALTGTDFQFEPLPAGVGFSLAVRRAIRSSAGDGIPIEDLGIAGTPYDMTRADLLHSNRDLIRHCITTLGAHDG
jgi:hypothetical protein